MPPRPAAETLARSDELAAKLRADDDGLVEVATGDGGLLARPVTGRLDGYRAVADGNLDLVLAAASAAGVDAVRLDTDDAGRHVVAVPADQAEALLPELARAHATDPVYLRALSPGSPGREVRGVLAGAVEAASWPADGPVLQVFRVWTGPRHRTVIGPGAACEVEFWRRDEHTGQWRPPRTNRWVSESPGWPPPGPPGYPLALDVQFPIDLVYTWVDGADPVLAARRARYLAQADPGAVHPSATRDARWRDRDELRYSLRSVEAFAPWIRHVWIVTEDQRPPWLDVDHPRVTLLSSRHVFTDPAGLPTFNSHAVEAQLHHIDGLAEHYLYANDDYFFGRPVRAEAFFLGSGLGRVFRSRMRIDPGPATAADRPVMSAHKNHRQLFERDFGVTIAARLRHAPAVQRRSVMYELEARYPEEFARTVAARFRSPGDLSFASTLGPYYLMLTGRAYPAPLAYGYVDTVEPETAGTLDRWLVDRDRDAFCVNDAGLVTEGLSAQQQHELVRSFLAEYFPWPSSFELSIDSPA